jgi:hypothetical protein
VITVVGILTPGLTEGAIVVFFVGIVVGILDGVTEGAKVNLFVGIVVGILDGFTEGAKVGVLVGIVVGIFDGFIEGTVVDFFVGIVVGKLVGLTEGTALDGIKVGFAVDLNVGIEVIFTVGFDGLRVLEIEGDKENTENVGIVDLGALEVDKEGKIERVKDGAKDEGNIEGVAYKLTDPPPVMINCPEQFEFL